MHEPTHVAGERDTHTQSARRIVTQALTKGLVSQFHPRASLVTLRLMLSQGLGAHMIHGLWAASVPERIAISDEHRTLRYREFDAEINQLVHALREEFEVGRGAAVAVMMANRVEYAAAWVATMRLKSRIVHVSYRSTADELSYQLADADARVLIVDAERLHVARAAALASERDLTIIACGAPKDTDKEIWRWRDLLRGRPDTMSRRPRRGDAANVVYTSGTTGRPYGAVRDFTSFGPEELFRVVERLGIHAGERHLVVAPMYHSAAQAFFLLQSALGNSIYLHEHFDAEHTLRTLSHERIHSIFMVPTMIRRVLDLDDALHRTYPTPALRAVVSGAAPFPHDLRQRAIGRFGKEAVFDFYGATEIGWVTLIRGDEMLARPHSVGRPIADQQVAIFDEDGGDVSTGEVGIVHVRNDQGMQGYLGNPGATEDVRRGEWLSVEDLGRLDADGYLYIEGRSRDMIISGGVNIYPVEIEEVLAEHPDVRDVAVIGLPDEEWGEVVAAVVEIARGADFDAAGLDAFAREHLSGLKIPRAWHLVDEVPRNPTGKALKNELRQRFTNASPREDA